MVKYAIIVVVFVLGAVTGGAVMYAMRAESAPVAARPQMLTPADRADRLTRRLDLSAEQRERALVVLQAAAARVHDSRARLNREIREILDDAQRERFDRFARP